MSKTIKLTALDLLCPRTWTRGTLHFDVENENYDVAVLQLQRSFRELLKEAPLLGGYLRDSKNRGDHMDEIVVPKEPTSFFTTQDFRNNPAGFDIGQYPLGEYTIGNAEVQIFAAQANLLEGSIVLQYCVHHMVMDGGAMGSVLFRWSEHCKALSNGTSPPPFSPKCLDRSMLLEGGMDNKSIVYPAYRTLPDQGRADLRPAAAQLREAINMPVNLFSMNVKSLERLKIAIMAHFHKQSNTEAWVSTNDVLTAVLWSSVTRARLGSEIAGKDRKSRLNYSVNARSKFNPPLPPNYMGCAAVFATTELPMASISATNVATVANTALAIRHGVNDINDTYLRALISYVNEVKDSNIIIPAPNWLLGDDVIINSWLDFAVGQLDWGKSLGRIQKLRKSRYASGKGYDGLLTVLPRKADGGIEVIISLRDEHMDRLMNDEDFGRYATLTTW